MSRQKILEIARAELGTIENPRNSNKTKYGAWYGLDGEPWCAMFVSWVYDQASLPLGRVENKKGYASCQAGYNFWKASNQLTKTPEPGDIIVYDWNGDGHCDHTGIFVDWILEGGSFNAYEGNTSVDDDSNGGIVMMRKRNVASVKAFINPGVLGVQTNGPAFDPSLRKGDKGARVTVLQKKLFDLKYDIVVDGDFGAQTERIIKKFQRDHQLQEDGISTPAVSGAIESALLQEDASVHRLTQGIYLKKGAAGAAVLAVQKALNNVLGVSTVREDGVFGDEMFIALKDFQTAAGLLADGIAGPQTFRELGIREI